MDRKILSVAAFFGMTAIILGAFGAHALKEILSPDQLQTFETGVKYQMYHALFLLFLGITTVITSTKKRSIFYLISIGVLFFSGSIYLLATGLADNVKSIVGPITPVGGLLLILGWLVFLIAIFRKKS